MTVLRQRMIANFSRAAAEYDARAHFQHGQTLRVFDAARMIVPPQARVLDIGCGTGQFAAMAASQSLGWQVIGLDIAPGMCKAAAARCLPVQADAQSLPLAASSVDAAVSSLCLQWAADMPAAFAELARVLRPGGRAIVASLAGGSLAELRAAAAQAALPLGLLDMPAAETHRSAAMAAGLGITMFKATPEVEYYPDVAALLDSMRRIGAGNSLAGRPAGMTGVRRWKAMLRHYETLRTPYGIPATWERVFMILHKPL